MYNLVSRHFQDQKLYKTLHFERKTALNIIFYRETMGRHSTIPDLFEDCKTITITYLKQWGYIAPKF